MKGNGKMRQNITLAHWNLGSKAWQRKRLEIELVTMEYDPDILVITEANLDIRIQDYEKNIKGYDMILPRTIERRNIARIVMLVKQDIQVEVLNAFMDTEVASIWVKLGEKGKKQLVLSGIYREHRILDGDGDADTNSDKDQQERWKAYVKMWTKAGRKNEVIVLGDTNLDYLRWDNPEKSKIKMVDEVKDNIETLGFHQLIQGYTRCWNMQPDSLIDQCWSNVPQKLVYHRNVVRSVSDHNLIVVSFRTKEKIENRHDIVKRLRKGMDAVAYKSDIAGIDWTELYNSNNVDIINNIFVEKVTEVLNKHAPLKTLQRRRNYKCWVDATLKESMLDRDRLREAARISGRQGIGRCTDKPGIGV